MSWGQLIGAVDHEERMESDDVYWAEHALKIRPKDGGLKPLRYNPPQIKLNNKLNELLATTGMVRAVIVKGRQFGISTMIAGRHLKKALANPGTRVGIIAHEKKASSNLLKLVRRYVDHLPPDLKPALATDNNEELVFEKLDSGYNVAVATEEGAGRSDTMQLVHGSEVSRWVNMSEQLAGLFQTVPRLPGTEIILETTSADYLDEFHQFWNASCAGETGFTPIFLSWLDHPDYTMQPTADFELTKEEREHKAQFKMTDGQLAWRRLKIGELRSLARFQQEFPLTAEESFMAANTRETFLSSKNVLKARKCTLDLAYGELVLGVDIGRSHDYTTIAWRRGRCILKVKRYKIPDLMAVAGIVAKIIDAEKPARVFIDSTGLGIGVVDRLHERGYDEVEGVNFSSKPTGVADDDTTYFNRRSQIYGNLREVLETNFKIPADDALHTQLTACGFKHRSDGSIQLEEKAEVKKRLGTSPDDADAVALTMSEPISTRIVKGQGGAGNFNRELGTARGTGA